MRLAGQSPKWSGTYLGSLVPSVIMLTHVHIFRFRRETLTQIGSLPSGNLYSFIQFSASVYRFKIKAIYLTLPRKSAASKSRPSSFAKASGSQMAFFSRTRSKKSQKGLSYPGEVVPRNLESENWPKLLIAFLFWRRYLCCNITLLTLKRRIHQFF